MDRGQLALETGCNIGSSVGHPLHASWRELFRGASRWTDAAHKGVGKQK